MELVTIVVPIYNVEKYLERCILSIINQTYKNIEILLVNDGSPDNSHKIMKKYEKKDNRIKCYYKENGGLSDTRNYALNIAKGKYICFIDSDDYIEKDFVEKMFNELEETDSDLVWCDFSMVNDEGETGEIIINEDDIWSFEMPSACNKMYKIDLFKNNNITFPVGIWYEDLATIPRLLFKSKKISKVNYKLYNYYFNPTSITKTYTMKVLDAMTAIKIVDDFVQENSIKDSEEKLEYLYLYNGILNTTYRLSMTPEAKISDIKNVIKISIERFPNIFKNKIATQRLDITRKILMLLIKMKLYCLVRFIIRFKKRVIK